MSRLLPGERRPQDPFTRYGIYEIYEPQRIIDARTSGWASRRLLHKDWLLCYEHSGDCFYSYFLLEYEKYIQPKEIRIRVMVNRQVYGYCLGQFIYKLDEQQVDKLVHQHNKIMLSYTGSTNREVTEIMQSLMGK